MFAKFPQYSGILDSVENILSSIGVTGDTATAVAVALASPTNYNIQAVVQAFQIEGTYPPPELMNLLYQRQFSAIQNNPVYTGAQISQSIGNWLPLLLIGGGLLFLSSRGRKNG
jgi:hypothetical protein